MIAAKKTPAKKASRAETSAKKTAKPAGKAAAKKKVAAKKASPDVSALAAEVLSPAQKAARERATVDKKRAQAKKRKAAQKEAVAKKKVAAVKKKAVERRATKTTKKPVAPSSASSSPAASNESPAEGARPGQPAIPFSLPADDGSTIDLASLAGKNVVLYFYPKDATPGCTVEACGFRDKMAELAEKDAVVLGVSRDSIAKHKSFKDKFHLPFSLLSDPEGHVIKAYGSWGEKSFMGRRFLGILRTTVLIGKDGQVKRIFEKVNPKTHADDVLLALSGLDN